MIVYLTLSRVEQQGSLFIPKIEFFINADIAGWNFYKVVMGNFFIKRGNFL